MVQLAVVGGAEQTWSEVGRRLRGATLDPAAPPDVCDGVVLATFAEEAVERHLTAGLHVLLLDVDALTPEQLDAWYALTRQGKALLSVVNPDRFLPSRQFARAQLDRNLGAPGLVRLRRWQPAPAGAGLLRDLDLVLWLMGRAPEVVQAVGGPDFFQVHLGFPGGGMALIDHATLPAGDGYTSVSVLGASGAVYADDHANRQLLFQGGLPRAVRTEEGDAGGLAALIGEFVEAVRAGDTNSSLAGWRPVLAARAAVEAALAAPKEDPGPAAGRGKTQGAPPHPRSPVFRCAVLSAVKHDYVARGVASHPRFEITVVADDPDVPGWAHERNQQLADDFKVPYLRDIESALRDFDIHVAIVSPEAERHADLSTRAARAGKHVVQDKPLATRRADAERLLKVVEEAGVAFLLWNRDFLPAVRHARELIASGAVGQLRAIHVDFYFAKDAGPPRGTRQPGYPPLDWYAHQVAAHSDGSDGGLGRAPMGELAIEAIYPLGYIRFLTGAEVKRVFARATAHFHQLYADNGVEDLASLTLELEGGLVGSVAVGRIGAASHPSGGEITIHLAGTSGALVVDESCPTVGLCYRGQPPREARRRRVGNDYDFLLADDLARALDEGGPTVLGIRDAHSIFLTVEAALASCRSGRPVCPDRLPVGGHQASG